MSYTFVFPDIHGVFDFIDKGLREVEKYAKEGTIVFLGDYIDRGPESREVVNKIYKGPPENWKWVALKGNHEDMMVGAQENSFWESNWHMNGGAETLTSYIGFPGDFEAHLYWMENLPSYHEDAHRVYVHGFVEPDTDLDKQSPQTMMWGRYSNIEHWGWKDKHVVHGHTPDREGPLLYQGRTNLDTGGVWTKRYVIGVFDDDKPGGPVDLIEVFSE